jgi:hypothetical protein
MVRNWRTGWKQSAACPLRGKRPRRAQAVIAPLMLPLKRLFQRAIPPQATFLMFRRPTRKTNGKRQPKLRRAPREALGVPERISVGLAHRLLLRSATITR